MNAMLSACMLQHYLMQVIAVQKKRSSATTSQLVMVPAMKNVIESNVGSTEVIGLSILPFVLKC